MASKYDKPANFVLEKLIERRNKSGNWFIIGESRDFGDPDGFKWELLRGLKNEFPELLEWERSQVLTSLIEDGYMDEDYRPTTKGIKFIQNGGFVEDFLEPLISLAEKFNQMKKDLGLDEIEKITSEFQELGISRNTLSEITPNEKPNTSITRYDIDIGLKDIHIKSLEKQIEYHQEQINDIKDRPSQQNRSLLITAVTTLGGVFLGWLLSYSPSNQKGFELNLGKDWPKIQIVHDTVYKNVYKEKESDNKK